MVTYSHEIKRLLLLGRKAMTNLDNVLKSRDITLPTKVPIYVWIWRLDHKKAEHQELILSNSGAGEDSWEFMDSKQIKPVKPIGNQPWIFIGVTDAEAEAQILCFFSREQTLWKRPWCWERLKARGEGCIRGWDVWMASSTQWTWVWANSGG